MIDIELLKTYGSTVKTCSKNETIFYQDDKPIYYYQVLSGEVKMSNLNEEGKEFVQGIFSSGRSFGEPPLFGDFNYPAHAVSLGNSEIIRLEKGRFLKLLQDHPSIYLDFLAILSKRIHYKATMMAEIANNKSSERILSLLDFLKFEIYGKSIEEKFAVNLTRKQIAELTGLRIETVIRAILSLEKQGELSIIESKIFR